MEQINRSLCAQGGSDPNDWAYEPFGFANDGLLSPLGTNVIRIPLTEAQRRFGLTPDADQPLIVEEK